MRKSDPRKPVTTSAMSATRALLDLDLRNAINDGDCSRPPVSFPRGRVHWHHRRSVATINLLPFEYEQMPRVGRWFRGRFEPSPLENKKYGAEVIKFAELAASCPRAHQSGRSNFPREEMKAISSIEAHQLGMKVRGSIAQIQGIPETASKSRASTFRRTCLPDHRGKAFVVRFQKGTRSVDGYLCIRTIFCQK